MILEMGKGDLEAKIGREFHRIEGAFAKELSRYPDMHRKIDDLVTRMDTDFQECASAAPAAPGWSEAVAAVAKMPPSGDGVVKKVLEEIHKSAVSGEKKALQDFRDATAKRHKILGAMAPVWKELTKISSEVGKAVTTGGAFVNFNLIALPMSELVPSGSRIGGMPVATVAAMVIVLMEVAAGVFAMEMLGITSFFPKMELLPLSRR